VKNWRRKAIALEMVIGENNGEAVSSPAKIGGIIGENISRAARKHHAARRASRNSLALIAHFHSAFSSAAPLRGCPLSTLAARSACAARCIDIFI
jgi:hypothetical protein